MDGDIIYPGDLHGRVVRANAVGVAWDGNAISALVGEDLVVGVSGFGDSVHEAVREVAESLIREGIWIEIPGEGEIDMKSVHQSGSGTIQTDSIELHRFDGGRMVAVVRAAVGASGAVVGTGDSVHEALRALANELVAQGVWIEVAARREWRPTQNSLQRCSRTRTSALPNVAGCSLASSTETLRMLNATSAARSFVLCPQQI